MNSKITLCFALVLGGGLFGCSTTANRLNAPVPQQQIPEQAEVRAWQMTLRNAITNATAPWCIPFTEPLGVMNYTVPADAAKILESQPPAGLLPFLAKLRPEPPSWKGSVVDAWIVIVANGLHGTPSLLKATTTTPEGVVVSMPDIPIYIYTDHFLHRRPKLY